MKVEKVSLSPPGLEELAAVVGAGLKSGWRTSSASVVECPDLSLPPFGLAAPGLGGSAALADVGGVGHLFPHILRDKRYALRDVCEAVGLPGSLVLGPGAAPHHKLGRNAEGMLNAHLGSGTNRSAYTGIQPDTDAPFTAAMGEGVEDFALMANLLLSEGRPSNVLKVTAEGRVGEANFPDSIRSALREGFGERQVSLGGAFLLTAGSANLHVMPDFPQTDFCSLDQIADSWLRFVDVPAPLVCLSVFHSADSHGLSLRMEHTHCYAPDLAHGGHYHYDTSPDQAAYQGYFVAPDTLFRIDQTDN